MYAPQSTPAPAAVSTATTSNCCHLRVPVGADAPIRFTARPPRRPTHSAAAAKISGVVNTIFVKASGSDAVDSAITQITHTLHERHHIQASQDDDFTVRNLNEIAAGVGERHAR